jgi:hypothetical protein
MKGQLITGDTAKPSKVQHKSPCSDCPFARTALQGWLGRFTAKEWIDIVRSEDRIECHTKIGPQCAGSAIFRTHIMKCPRDRAILTLPKNVAKVFASIGEFLNHHLKTDRFDHWGRG